MIAAQPTLPWRRIRRWTVVGLCVVAALILGFALRDVFNPFLLGLLLAYVLNPMVEGLQRRGVSRRVAVPVLFAAVLGIGGGITSVATIQAAQRLGALEGKLVGEAVLTPLDPEDAALLELRAALDAGDEVQAPLGDLERARLIRTHDGEAFVDEDGDGARKIGLVEEVGEFLSTRLNLVFSPTTLKEMARDLGQHASSLAGMGARFSQGIRRSLTELGQFFSYVMLVPLYTFFLLQSFPQLVEAVRAHLPAGSRPQLVTMALEIDRQVAAFFRGKLLLALGKGLLTSLGLWIAGVPFSVFIGLVAGALSIVPMIGPLVGGVLAVILCFDTPDQGFGLRLLGVAATFGIVEVLDAVAQPVVLGREVGLSPLALILSLFLFGELFGLFGVLLAVPIACAIRTILIELVLPEVQALAGLGDASGEGEVFTPAVPTFRRG